MDAERSPLRGLAANPQHNNGLSVSTARRFLTNVKVFAAGGRGTIRDSTILEHRWVRVVPHVNDTIL